MLAGIPKGPTYYSPFNDEERAFKRQKDILKQLFQTKMITQAEYYEAQKEELNFTEPNLNTDTFAAFFKDTVLKEAATLRSEEHTSELQSRGHLVCRLLLEKNNETIKI